MKSGIAVPAIARQTTVSAQRVRTIITRAMAQGVIERVSRGIYAAKSKPTASVNATMAVLKIIEKSPKGIGIPELKEKSGLEEKKLRNILFRLYSQKKIQRIRRGVYGAAKV